MLRAYTVIAKEAYEDENAALIFAHSNHEARRIGRNIFDDYAISVKRVPQVDAMAKPDVTHAYECCNDEICVAAGLRPDGWSYCRDCGELTNNLDDGEYVCKSCELEGRDNG